MNVILIVLDTMRYDYFNRVVLDRISYRLRNIMVFSNAFSTATWTPPSHASIFTGKYPHQHGVLARGETVPPLKEPGLAYKLKQLGLNTIAVTSNPTVVPFLGRGFSHIIEVDVGRRRLLHELIPLASLRSHYDPTNKIVRTIRKFIRNTYYFLKDLITLGEKYYGSSVVINTIIDLIERSIVKEPFFLFINLMDAHDYLSYTNILNRWRMKVSIHRDLLSKIYANSCMKLAHTLDELIKFFAEKDLIERSLIIITSDHGELLGEYGLSGHGQAYPFDELIHIPLVISDPSISDMVEIPNIVSLKDIYDFILNRIIGMESIPERVKKLPGYVVVEDRTLGSREVKHYRCVIKPPYKIVFDVINRNYEAKIINLKGYHISEKQNLREVIRIMKRIDIEARIYEKLRVARKKLTT